MAFGLRRREGRHLYIRPFPSHSICTKWTTSIRNTLFVLFAIDLVHLVYVLRIRVASRFGLAPSNDSALLSYCYRSTDIDEALALTLGAFSRSTQTTDEVELKAFARFVLLFFARTLLYAPCFSDLACSLLACPFFSYRTCITLYCARKLSQMYVCESSLLIVCSTTPIIKNYSTDLSYFRLDSQSAIPTVVIKSQLIV